MESEQLLGLVEKVRQLKCETQTVEVKAAHEGCPKSLFDSLSAFSNQDDGGTLLFGLDEKSGFEVVGVYDAQDLQKHVVEQCNQMSPPVRPLFTVCDIDGNIVVSAEIPGADITDRPVYYRGKGKVKGSYIRVGEADEPLSAYEVYSYDAYRRRIRDDIRETDTSVSQLDAEQLGAYIAAVKNNKPNTAKLTDEEILELMSIIKTGKPTLAGVLCFSKYPQASFPQLCVTAVVIPGTEMGESGADGARFLDNKRIEGTIGEMLEDSIAFVRRNMREKTIVDGDGKRSDKTEYPIMAIREAVLNALMHRDYSIHTEGTPVRILMFNDRIEIKNEGGLYGKLTLETLGKTHADTRNQTLTNILEILKIAENRYSGIPTIRAAMREYKLPEPVFEARSGSFTVTLKNGTGYYKRKGDYYSTEIDLELLEIFCREPRSRAEISQHLGLSQYYAMKMVVAPLLESGELRMTIPDKPKSRNQKYYSVI
ncbi:MAG: putative DNA binding domain-containing protein [Oscillospiraceae bacterium]|jgi:ATP-dependent DNA helicase RecG|nr:putative DNA binding domain-containing protein [Oscillospiraceae bacterium]